MSCRQQQVLADSDARVVKRLAEANKIDLANFDAKTDMGLKVIEWENPDMIVRQQGRRIIWMTKNEKYCSARYYVNADCARQIIDELVRLGCKNCHKEDDNNEQIELF